MHKRLLQSQWNYPDAQKLNSPVMNFLEMGRDIIMEQYSDVHPLIAWQYMAQATEDFLECEDVEFGHPDYGWDIHGARAIAYEFILDYE